MVEATNSASANKRYEEMEEEVFTFSDQKMREFYDSQKDFVHSFSNQVRELA